MREAERAVRRADAAEAKTKAEDAQEVAARADGSAAADAEDIELVNRDNDAASTGISTTGMTSGGGNGGGPGGNGNGGGGGKPGGEDPPPEVTSCADKSSDFPAFVYTKVNSNKRGSPVGHDFYLSNANGDCSVLIYSSSYKSSIQRSMV